MESKENMLQGNKLQELTEKLYQEGLSRGKTESDKLISEAQSKAELIVSEAQSKAKLIVSDAQSKAKLLHQNTINEVKLSSNQLISTLKTQIQNTITTQVINPQIELAWNDQSFIKTLIIKTIESFNDNNQQVKIAIPQNMVDMVKNDIISKLNKTVEIITDDKIKVPFKIIPNDKNYYISFTDEDFKTLFKAYIRPTIADILYK